MVDTGDASAAELIHTCHRRRKPRRLAAIAPRSRWRIDQTEVFAVLADGDESRQPHDQRCGCQAGGEYESPAGRGMRWLRIDHGSPQQTSSYQPIYRRLEQIRTYPWFLSLGSCRLRVWTNTRSIRVGMTVL